MSRWNRVILVGVWALLLLLLPACETQEQESSSTSSQEEILWLPQGEWPVNRFTATLPQPTQGTVASAWMDTNQTYCAISMNFTAQQSQDYLDQLRSAGFQTVVEGEQPERGQEDVVVHTFLLQGEEVSLSISYLTGGAESFGMCITQQPVDGGPMGMPIQTDLIWE